MTTTVSPIEAAAVPSVIALVQALQAFITNMGTDPTQLVAKFPGALQVLIGTVELQLPALATAELGAVQTDINSKLASWVTALQAIGAKAA